MVGVARSITARGLRVVRVLWRGAHAVAGWLLAPVAALLLVAAAGRLTPAGAVSPGARASTAPTTIGTFVGVPVPNPGSNPTNALDAVSCPDGSFCVAVGSGTANGFQFAGIADAWNGSWSAMSPVDPEGSNMLRAVSCTSASFCMAVGSATSGVAYGPGDVLVEEWNGSAWSVLPAPDGSPSNEDNDLLGVSCTSTTFCVAVGDTGTSGATQALIEEWNGGQWTLVDGGSAGLAPLDAVACASSSTCMAVGAGNGSASFDGSTWSRVAGPASLDASSPALAGIACEDAVTCTAVGSTSDASGAGLLAEEWNGTAWSVVALPPTTVQPRNGLSSVSCVGSSCIAGGQAGGSAVQFVIADGSARQAAPPVDGANTAIGGVSCTAAACEGVGDDGLATMAEAAPVGSGSDPWVHGYWLVGGDGGIFTFGSTQFYGSTGAAHLQRPVVGITPTADRLGYWLVASDGGIFAFGDAGFYGSVPGMGIAPAGSRTSLHLDAPIVAVVPSADGAGYFMVAADGGVFAFGDARFAGSCPGIGGCVGSAVAVMPDATGAGYWLVTSTGAVYAFGDATPHGSPGGRSVPVASAVRTPDGGGYWILFADGTVAAEGDAAALGSVAPGGAGGLDPATAIVPTADGSGYWVATADGAVYPFGDAPGEGGMAGQHLNAPIIAATGW